MRSRLNILTISCSTYSISHRGAVIAAVNAQLASLKSPPQTVSQLLDTLRAQGLAQSVARLRELLGG